MFESDTHKDNMKVKEYCAENRHFPKEKIKEEARNCDHIIVDFGVRVYHHNVLQ